MATTLSSIINSGAASGGYLIRKQQIFTASGTFTPTSKMISAGGQCEVLCVAGGGGTSNGTGGGGSSGGCVKLRVLNGVTSAQSVVVGAGGAQGEVGGTSSFGSLVSSEGGKPCTGSAPAVSAGEGSGAGGASGNAFSAGAAGAYGFGAGGTPSSTVTPPANTGMGGNLMAGASGIVIVTFWETP